MRLPLFIVLLFSSQIYSQVLGKKLREVKFPGDVTSISIDRLGGFYTVNECGILQFNTEGEMTHSYNPRGCTPTEILECWGYANLYGYQKHHQHFRVFSNSMQTLEDQPIDSSFAIEPQLATVSTDMRYWWILDFDNTLRKVDWKNNTVLFESDALKDFKAQFTHMREYQSMFFVLDKKSGIYVLNNLGNLVSKIEVPDINYFSFAGEDLYYLKGNKVHFHNIYNKDSYSISVKDGFKFVVATDERMILIKDGFAEVYEFKPKAE